MNKGKKEEALIKTKIVCPHCKESIELSKDFLKQTIVCPSCGGDLTLPKNELKDESKKEERKPFSFLFTLLGCGVTFCVLCLVAAFSSQIFHHPSLIYILGIVALVGLFVFFLKRKLK